MQSIRSLMMVLAACLAVPGTALAIGDDPADRESVAEWYTRGDRFYLYDENETELVNFSETRDVRVCAATRRSDIPLKVRHDDKTSIVRSGNCLTVDAKKVTVSPAEELPPHVELTGHVETR